MAVEFEDGPIKDFDLWYVDRKVDPRNGCIETRGGLSDQATRLIRRYDYFKREMDARCADYEKLVLLADGEVISPKPDLPNVSSGETAGIVRRIARNLVQHTPMWRSSTSSTTTARRGSSPGISSSRKSSALTCTRMTCSRTCSPPPSCH